MSEFNGLLTAIVFLPLVGVVFILLFGSQAQSVRYIAGGTVVVSFLLSIWAWASFDGGTTSYTFAKDGAEHVFAGLGHVDRLPWIPAINAEYFLGVDGISLPFVVLTNLLGLAAVYASWRIKNRVREYFIWLLVLQTAVLGVFTSLDFLLFFLFWELELVPMYMLISIWGTGRREYSAMKFLIFTLAAGAALLVSLLLLFASIGSFDITNMIALGQGGVLTPDLVIAGEAILAFLLLGFAIKLPIFPFHTWLPDAHTDAPTAVSIMLAGVLLKMGGYGIIRFGVGIFPDIVEDWGVYLATLGAVSVIYGAIVTLKQTDLKRLVAFSSVSHMGLVTLGIASMNQLGVAGASVQMVTHGTITGLLFLVVGIVYDKAHTRHIPDLGGLAPRMPFTAAIFLLAGLASLGLPATSGFVAEIMVFLGSFEAQAVATAVAAFGVVLAAGYILWTVERVLFGPEKRQFVDLTDATLVDAVPMVLLTAVIVLIGVYPAIIVDIVNPGIAQLVGG